jgi:hypothetical protein
MMNIMTTILALTNAANKIKKSAHKTWFKKDQCIKPIPAKNKEL